jgi:hypothetical protein
MDAKALLQTGQTILALLVVANPKAEATAKLVVSSMRLLNDVIIPGIRDAVKRGELDPAEETAIAARYDAFAAGVATGAAFTGAEWTPSGQA